MKKLKELSGSESLFGFCAWLTTNKEKTVMGAKNDCAPIADLVKQFCDTNKIADPRDNWDKLLIHPKN